MLFNLFRTQRRHIFVDCGGHNGSSVRKFRTEMDPSSRFKIYTFEPNPSFADCYSEHSNHTLIKSAIWIEDGHKEFFLDREDGDGSTFFPEKLTRHNGGYGELDTINPLVVPTVDLSAWLINNVEKRDYVILKLDIEGAEYDVLDKLFDQESIRLIDKLFIEWHWFKVGIPELRHNDLVGRLKSIRLPVTEWDAQVFA